MYQLLVLYPPPQDPDAFRAYYESVHIPLAAQLPGMRAYRYSFTVAAADPPSPYFCVFEADFDDAESMGAALSSPEGARVAADVPNYASGGSILLHFEATTSA